MSPNPDTPATFLAVPSHPRLYRRDNGIYYLRAKVPEAIRPVIKRTEVRISLKTNNHSAAVAQVKIESLKVDRRFAEARRKTSGGPPAAKLSREEAIWMVADWFVKAEERAERWIENVDPQTAGQVAETLKEDSAAFGASGA